MSDLNKLNKVCQENKVSGDIEFIKTIPSEWNTLKAKYIFRHIVNYSSSGTEDLLSVSEYYGVAPKADVLHDSDFLSRAESLEGYKKNEKYDLIINIMLAWKKALGVAPIDGIVSPAYAVFRLINLSKNVPQYYHYLLRTDLFATIFKKHSTGIIDSRLRLYPEAFGNIKLLVPPYNDQLAISRFLDQKTKKIDDIIVLKKKYLKLLREKRQAIIDEVVTKGLDPNVPMKYSGIGWLGNVPAHWVLQKMKYVASKIIDAEHKTAPTFDEGKYYVVRTSNVKKGKLVSVDLKTTTFDVFKKWTMRGLPEVGDLMLTREAPAGEACLVPDVDNICLGQRMVLIKLKKQVISPQFCLYSIYGGLAATYISLLSQGSTVSHFNMSDIYNIPIFLPPYDEQIEINNYLEIKLYQIDKLIDKIIHHTEKLQEYRQALISEAVTGRIDVREYGRGSIE